MPLPRFHKLEPAKQKELLDAATAELAEKGFDGASIAAVVERAGASRSAVYYYFEDKEDLFRTVLRRSIEEAMQTVGEIDLEAEDFWQAMRRKKLAIMSHFAGRPGDMAIWRMAFRVDQQHPHPACIGDMHDEMRTKWGMMLAAGRSKGAVREDLPEELCIDLVLSIDGIMQQHFIRSLEEGYDEQRATAHVERSVDLLERVLRPGGEERSA